MTNDLGVLVKTAWIEELEKLRDDIGALAEPLSEAELWSKPVELSNSCGHLLLHLTGNLNHFIGAQLGGSDYVRDRQREFTETQPPSKAEALRQLDAAVALCRDVTGRLTAEQLTAPHPEARFGAVGQALVHLLAHFALHRGQMAYIARWVKCCPRG